MHTNTNILNELKLLSPLIAKINNKNILTAPSGYFDSLSDTILSNLQENIAFLKPLNEFKPDIPAGYFDQLSNNILYKIRLTDLAGNELKILSPILSSIQKNEIFEVPANYFDMVSTQFFEHLYSISAEPEIKELSPLLHNSYNKITYEVPKGYFEILDQTILSNVKKPVAKVAFMQKRSLFVKYAIAAMITGVSIFGFYKYNNKPVDQIIANVKLASLDASIEKGIKMNDIQFIETLQNLNEVEIAKYLEKNVDITDLAVVSNNLEENNLPNEDAYLLNEKTLENYLKEIEITN